MENEASKKVFNHDNAGLADRLALVAELEHLRRHALRSAVSTAGTENEIFFLVVSKRCKDLRRQYMQKYFSGVSDELWCALKACSCIRQLSYETTDDPEFLKPLDDLCDEVFSRALGEDMFGCVACKEDRGDGEEKGGGLPPLGGVNTDGFVLPKDEDGHSMPTTSHASLPRHD